MVDLCLPVQRFARLSVLETVPHYFFNVYNDDITIDDEGTDLVDGVAAKARAIKEARALAADTVLRGHFVSSHRIEIVDQERKPVCSVRFDEAVQVCP